MTTWESVYVVHCACGMFPLDEAAHRTSQAAWEAASRHVALNPTACRPTFARAHAPAGVIR
jgi:hypothetical protein